MFGNVEELPKPIGKYHVGTKEFVFEDNTRKQVFHFEKEEDTRKIPIIVYYPCDNIRDKKTASYMTKEEAKLISKNYMYLVPKRLYKVKTHLYKDAPITNDNVSFPVIIYSHGYGSFIQNNTILLTNLASMGYVVVSIGHPYQACVLRYLDGSLIQKHPDLMSLMKQSKEDKNELKLLFQGRFETDQQILDLERKYNSYIDNDLHSYVQVWVEDTNFISSKLEQMNKGEIESILNGRLDFSCGIGVMGHSYGGSTAGQSCLKEKRYSCGVNIDCGTFGEYGEQDIKTPFMSIGAPYIKLIGKSTYIMNSHDSYMINLSNTKHLSFTDALYTSRALNIFNRLGKRDKDEVHNIVISYISTFFDKYLKRNELSNLVDLNFEGVQFSYNRMKED